MSKKKKLYHFEFTVTEVCDYKIEVEAENYEQADDLAMKELGNDKWLVNAYTDNWECTYQGDDRDE
tara:strand:- start:324 stop:521 length:198 start_codon:yes stop_codon:yes gene_type:complete